MVSSKATKNLLRMSRSIAAAMVGSDMSWPMRGRRGRPGWRDLVLHPVVLGPHRDGLRIHAVSEVLHPPLGRRHGLVVVLLPDLGRLAVAARLCDHLLDVFRADPRGIVADVDEVVLPVQPDVGDVRLLSQGSLDGIGAASGSARPGARTCRRAHAEDAWVIELLSRLRDRYWSWWLLLSNASTSSLAPIS